MPVVESRYFPQAPPHDVAGPQELKAELGLEAPVRLQSLLPRGAVAIEAGPEDYIAPLHPLEADLFARRPLADRRLAEIRAGRSCARRALSKLGLDDFAVLSTPSRAPQWPGGFVGSITHSGGYCAAAVARSDVALGLGIDAEAWIDFPMEVLDQVCRPREWERLTDSFDDTRKALCFAFSAKEAVYKALHPLVGAILDFHDVELEAAADCGRFEVHGAVLEKAPQFASALSGRFLVSTNLVLTAVTVEE